MKRIFLIASIVCLVLQPVLADTEAEYNRARLSIEYKSGVFGVWTQYGGSVSTYDKWRFYKGFTKIKESEFLNIAGYNEEAQTATEHRKINNILTGTAWALIGGGRRDTWPCDMGVVRGR